MNKYVSVLQAQLCARAEHVGLLVDLEAKVLNERHFSLFEDPTPDESEDPDELPTLQEVKFFRKSMCLGDFSVIIGEIGPKPEDAFAALSDHLLQAAKARSHLGPKKENLLLFLVGPACPAGDPNWTDIVYEVERDERICRKMVFLPPPAEGDVDAEIGWFISRTFLARPWERSTAQTDLDPLLTTLNDTSDIPPAWIPIIRRGEGDASALVDQLLENLQSAAIS